MVKIDRNIIMDGLKALLAIILMTVVNFFFPLLSIVILVIWPIPIVVMALKHGMKEAGVVITLAAVLNGFFFGPLMGLITIIGFGFVGFIIGGSLREGFAPLKTLLLTVAGVLVSQLLIVAISHYVFDFDFQNLIFEVLNSLSESGGFSDLNELLENQARLIKTVFPAIVMISSILTGILNYYITLWYLNNRGFEKDVFLPVKYWHFNRWLVSLGIVVALILKTNPVFINLNIILLFLVFIQGFAVGLYYIEKMDSHLFVRWLYIFAVLFVPPVPVILLLAGLIDMWFDLRKLN